MDSRKTSEIPMTPRRNAAHRAARVAPLFLLSSLSAQGYVAMTATPLPQTNAPAGIADAGLAARADGSWGL
jgi:hypothetical protein